MSLQNISSVNSGPLAGFRNRVINGGMQVTQRPAITLSAVNQYGAVDRMLAGVTGGTAVSGTLTGIPGQPSFASGSILAFQGASWTNGQATVIHRIEAKNVQDFGGKNVTISLKLYQDTGTTRTFNVALQKANTLDNFTATTNIATGTVAVPSTSVISGSVTLTLGATDAANGVQIVVQDNTANTVSNKNYYFGDLQIELGSVATPFEQRPYGTELSLCQRYYEAGNLVQRESAFTATAQMLIAVRLCTQKRVAPTVVGTNNGSSGLGTVVTAFVAGTQDIQLAMTHTTNDGFMNVLWTASAEL